MIRTPHHFLAIDPGACAGWAVFVDGLLYSCGVSMSPDTFQPVEPVHFGDWSPPREGVCEIPKYRPREENPQSILTLGITAGKYMGAMRNWNIRPVFVSEWKGNTPKDICHARAYAKLSAPESRILTDAGRAMAPSKRHNMLDAVALALWGLAR